MSCLIPYNPHLFPVFLFTSSLYVFVMNAVFASYRCFNLLGYPGWILFIDSYDSIWNIFSYNAENYFGEHVYHNILFKIAKFKVPINVHQGVTDG